MFPKTAGSALMFALAILVAIVAIRLVRMKRAATADVRKHWPIASVIMSVLLALISIPVEFLRMNESVPVPVATIVAILMGIAISLVIVFTAWRKHFVQAHLYAITTFLLFAAGSRLSSSGAWDNPGAASLLSDTFWANVWADLAYTFMWLFPLTLLVIGIVRFLRWVNRIAEERDNASENAGADNATPPANQPVGYQHMFDFGTPGSQTQPQPPVGGRQRPARSGQPPRRTAQRRTAPPTSSATPPQWPLGPNNP